MLCPDGAFSTDGATVCTSCPVGTYSQSGSASCSDCGAGFYCPDESSSPIACPIGYHSSSSSMLHYYSILSLQPLPTVQLALQVRIPQRTELRLVLRVLLGHIARMEHNRSLVHKDFTAIRVHRRVRRVP